MRDGDRSPAQIAGAAAAAKKNKGRPKRDRSGEEHPGFTVLAPVPGTVFGWLCRCRTCHRKFWIATSRLKPYSRRGNGCGCRSTGGSNRARRSDSIAPDLAKLKLL